MKLIVIVTLTVLSFTECKVVHLKCKQIRAFVDGHNSRRLLLAEGKLKGHPAASDMKKIVWDDELAEKAAKWAADQAKNDNFYQHNPSKTIPSGRFETSENLYWYSTTDLKYKINPETALDTWFNENKNFTFGPLDSGHFSLGKQEVGHYTQMVWSDSIYIGCAISKKEKQGWNHYLVVCNYGPAGNYLGSKPYETRGGASGKLECAHDQCSRPYGKKC